MITMKRAAVMLTALLVLLLTACGGGGAASSGAAAAGAQAEGSAPAPVDFSQHEEFSFWNRSTPNNYYASYDDAPVTQFLNKKFNVTLKWEQPPTGEEQNALSLMFGTGEYSDAIDMSYYSGSIQQLYEEGVIIDVSQYLDYMPNYKAYMDAHPDYKRAQYTDGGQILQIKGPTVSPIAWGGLVYRKDIINTMTGGSPAYPSGNASPTTIADWEYMLTLMQQYFQAAGMADSAPLIIPFNGYFGFSELTNSFGVAVGNYIGADGKVHYGMIEEGFYNYLKTMRDWYAKGWIYKDFASRTQDPFYLPNTSLTYGGAAGIWYGLSSQLGDVMSMPEYGLIFEVDALKSPIWAAGGITEAPPFGVTTPGEAGMTGTAIAASCKNIPKLLTIIDFFFTEEGSMLKTYGVNAEQGAADIPVMANNGLSDGLYSMKDGVFAWNPKTTIAGGDIDYSFLVGTLYPGIDNRAWGNREIEVEANELWTAYSDSKLTKLPSAISLTTEEQQRTAVIYTNVTDYANAKISRFIMGNDTLDDAAWADFKAQLLSLGINDYVSIYQAAYERYMAR
jgi:hypothetical protein